VHSRACQFGVAGTVVVERDTNVPLTDLSGSDIAYDAQLLAACA